MTGVDPKGLPQAVIERAMMFECAACTAAGIETNCYPANLSFLVGSRVLCEDCYDERGSDAVAPRVADMLPAALTPLKGAPPTHRHLKSGHLVRVIGEAATELVNFAWSTVVTDCTESAEYLNDLVDNLRIALAGQLPAPGEGDAPTWREFDHETIDYVLRYGGRCRECADHHGLCPNGLPCDVDDAKTAIRWVLKALNYGIGNGFLPSPALSQPQPDEMQPDTYTGGDFNGVVRGKRP